jgi:hypothetical protein
MRAGSPGRILFKKKISVAVPRSKGIIPRMRRMRKANMGRIY